MRMNAVKAAGLAALLAWPALASADPITIISDQRTAIVLAHIRVDGVTDRTPVTMGPGDDLTATSSATVGSSSGSATASLLSSFADPSHMSGSASTSIAYDTIDLGDFSASSTFAIDFQLSAPYTYTFSGTFENTGDQTGGLLTSSAGQWQASLSAGSLSFFNEFSRAPGVPNMTGSLAPGIYHLLVDAGAFGFTSRDGASIAANSGFRFAFDLAPAQVPTPSPTPEPASLVLLGTAAMGVFGARATKLLGSR